MAVLWCWHRKRFIDRSLGNAARYALLTLMLVAGVTVETLGVYVILVAGTNLLPERLRFRQYKLWMRTVVALWWAVLLAGAATFYVWYLVPS